MTVFCPFLMKYNKVHLFTHIRWISWRDTTATFCLLCLSLSVPAPQSLTWLEESYVIVLETFPEGIVLERTSLKKTYIFCWELPHTATRNGRFEMLGGSRLNRFSVDVVLSLPRIFWPFSKPRLCLWGSAQAIGWLRGCFDNMRVLHRRSGLQTRGLSLKLNPKLKPWFRKGPLIHL